MSSVSIDTISGITLYLKEATSGAPAVSSPWSTGVVTGTFDGATNRWSFTTVDGQEYLVYQRLGGSPASTDTEVGYISGSDSTSVAPTYVETADTAELVTLSDVVVALIDRSMAPEEDARTVRLMTAAVQQAMRDIPKRGKWMHYTGLLRFRTSSQVSPTVSYTESTRTMTITDGTNIWPTDVTEGEILYGNTPFVVLSRVSDTVITLSPDGTIGQNLTNTTVQWQRQRYHFRKQFSKVHYLINLDNRLPLAFVDIATFYERQRLVRFAGIPSLYSLRNSETNGWTDIVISPASTTSYLFEAQVSYQPTVPRIYRMSGDNGTISSGSKTFTAVGASFTADCEGAVFRIYNSTQDVAFGRPIFESFIVSKDSTTQLTLAKACPSSYVGSAVYAVSSHIDIDQVLMGTLLENSAYANYCQNHDHKGFQQAKVIEKNTLVEALAANTKLNHSTSREFAWSLAMARPSEYAQLTGPVG